MPWPTPQEYNEAIQNLAQNVVDGELRAGSVEVTPLGLPRPITGNFASVYRISCRGRDFAVRCFWREYADMPARYAAISRHLATARLPYSVGFDYQEQGIRIRGTWFPLLKMEWVRGALLDEYVRSHVRDGAAVRALAGQWVEMIAALERCGIAHGDLQHGNVLVTDTGLKLVDYDAMYVPALAGRGSHEVGHQHYQHPARTGGDFSPHTDRFSAWVIYLSLIALAARPELWDELRGGDECLLLRRDDFLDPASSRALRLMLERGDAELQTLTRSFQSTLARPPERTPSLVEALAPPGKAAGGRLPHSKHHPDWLADHLPHPAPFRPSVRVPRICLALAVPILIGALVATIFAGPMLLGVALLATVADTAVIAAWFQAERSVGERRALRRQERARRWAVWRAAQRRRRLERRLQRLAARRARWEARELHRVAASRERARADRDAAAALLADRVAAIDDQLRAIDEREKHDLAAALERYQARYLTRELRRRHILTADVRGIGPVLKLRAWVMGVRTAADVTSERIERLRTFGSSAVEALVGWRLDADVAARRSLPAALPDTARRRATAHHVAARSRAERQRDKAIACKRRLADAIETRLAHRVEMSDAWLAEQGKRFDSRAVALCRQVEAARGVEQSAETRLEEVRAELALYDEVRFSRYLLASLRGWETQRL